MKTTKPKKKKKTKPQATARVVNGFISFKTDAITRAKLETIQRCEKLESFSALMRHLIFSGIEHYEKHAHLPPLQDMARVKKRGRQRIYTVPHED